MTSVGPDGGGGGVSPLTGGLLLRPSLPAEDPVASLAFAFFLVMASVHRWLELKWETQFSKMVKSPNLEFAFAVSNLESLSARQVAVKIMA